LIAEHRQREKTTEKRGEQVRRAGLLKNGGMGAVLILVGLLLLPGCPAGTYGSKISAEQKAAIVKGKTTKVDLLRELGNPDQTIDVGGGKEQLSYIKEKYTTYGVTASSENTEFWILLSNGVVTDFGERPTTKSTNYMK
jgi:hypothetical protein